MVTVLTALCALVVVFAGGCGIVSLVFALLPLTAICFFLVGLNVFVILAIRRRRPPNYAEFMILAAIDLLLATGIVWVLATQFEELKKPTTGPWWIAAVWAVALFIKGVLTIAAAAWLRREAARPVAENEPRGGGGGRPRG